MPHLFNNHAIYIERVEYRSKVYIERVEYRSKGVESDCVYTL